MVEITKKTWERNGVEVIAFNSKEWLNATNIKKFKFSSCHITISFKVYKTNTGTTKL